MKKILFLDRDGTIIVEPQDEQVDSLEKLEFVPGVITNLRRIVKELNYLLVMVTNQDGLGTESFPETKFWPTHDKMLNILAGEGITFDDIIIDRSFAKDNLSTRKPGTGLLTKYMNGKFDIENSFVIGDRVSDLQLSKNLGSKSILFGTEKRNSGSLCCSHWEDIYSHLYAQDRVSRVYRKSTETEISVSLGIDGKGVAKISTGIGFFDHMLELLARHASFDLEIQAAGDLQVDAHHTIEDTAIALGEAMNQALGKKTGIERYGFLLPMDEAVAEVAVDLSGRKSLIWEAVFRREYIGNMPTEMFQHFFKSFSDSCGCNLYIKVNGTNEHHKIEAVFKAVARSLKMAVQRNPENNKIPSTKGFL